MADSYADWLRQDTEKMIDMLDLTDLQRHYMKSRWLEQVLWMEHRAVQARDRYYLLRRITIVGGVIVPALVGLNAKEGIFGNVLYLLVFGISLSVSITAAMEEFHRYNDRWRHYRSIVEEMKIIGWQYSQLGGPFKDYSTHRAGYVAFVNAVEALIQREVEIFVTNTNVDQRKQDETTPTSRPKELDDIERSPLFN